MNQSKVCWFNSYSVFWSLIVEASLYYFGFRVRQFRRLWRWLPLRLCDVVHCYDQLLCDLCWLLLFKCDWFSDLFSLHVVVSMCSVTHLVQKFFRLLKSFVGFVITLASLICCSVWKIRSCIIFSHASYFLKVVTSCGCGSSVWCIVASDFWDLEVLFRVFWTLQHVVISLKWLGTEVNSIMKLICGLSIDYVFGIRLLVKVCASLGKDMKLIL